MHALVRDSRVVMLLNEIVEGTAFIPITASISFPGTEREAL